MCVTWGEIQSTNRWSILASTRKSKPTTRAQLPTNAVANARICTATESLFCQRGIICLFVEVIESDLKASVSLQHVDENHFGDETKPSLQTKRRSRAAKKCAVRTLFSSLTATDPQRQAGMSRHSQYTQCSSFCSCAHPPSFLSAFVGEKFRANGAGVVYVVVQPEVVGVEAHDEPDCGRRGAAQPL